MATLKPCTECGTPYEPRRYDQRFCGKVCSRTYTNREMVRGSYLYAYAYNWRKNKQGNFSALTREIDKMIREDREAGRKGPQGYHPQDTTYGDV